MWLDNVIFEDKVIENERIELRDKNALYYLGPNLILRSCTLVLRVPTRRLLLCGQAGVSEERIMALLEGHADVIY